MKVITVGNQKGGVGKSTIACNLAVEATRIGLKTLLIDADTPQSSIDFRAARAEDESLPQFNAVSITKGTIHKEVNSFQDFDLIIVDVGGRDTAVFRSAILASDLLLIPVLPSQYDIWATQDTIEALREAQSFREIQSWFVLNQVIPNTTVAMEALEFLEDYEIPVLQAKLHARVAFKKSIPEGKGAGEYENGKAAREIGALWEEVTDLV